MVKSNSYLCSRLIQTCKGEYISNALITTEEQMEELVERIYNTMYDYIDREEIAIHNAPKVISATNYDLIDFRAIIKVAREKCWNVANSRVPKYNPQIQDIALHLYNRLLDFESTITLHLN